MGLFEFFKRKKCSKQNPIETATEIYIPAIKSEPKDSDKEEAIVSAVTLEDMKQFKSLPFDWNCNIKKVIGPNTRPYAYMDIIGKNVDIVVNELENMNAALLFIRHLSPLIQLTLQIPTKDVLIEPRDNGSYSKIMCTPHTFMGRISKYPASLHFVTELHVPDIDTTHGALFYDRKGKVAKARICFWRDHHGYFVYFQTVNEDLVITKIESTVVTNSRGLPSVIYKAPIP